MSDPFFAALLVGLLVALLVYTGFKYFLSDKSHAEKMEELHMKVTDYNRKVSGREGKKVELTIAQIAEVNRINNELTDGQFYRLVRRRK